MTTDQRQISQYIPRKQPKRSAVDNVYMIQYPTGLYCREDNRHIYNTALAVRCEHYVEGRISFGRETYPSCVYCVRSVNPKVDSTYRIRKFENEKEGIKY